MRRRVPELKRVALRSGDCSSKLGFQESKLVADPSNAFF